jgi:hypothetical protein
LASIADAATTHAPTVDGMDAKQLKKEAKDAKRAAKLVKQAKGEASSNSLTPFQCGRFSY